MTAKINQDNYIYLTNIFDIYDFSIFGVFDGHGDNGHLVSQYISDYFKIKSFINYIINIFLILDFII